MLKHAWILTVAGLGLWACAGELAAAAEVPARSNAPYTIDKWDNETEDGLPQNEVIAMTQTRDGYLWLGTLGGLVRFDGLHFTVFDEGNTPGLNSSRIVHLFEDGEGTLWIGTQTAGISILRHGQISSLPEMGAGGSERRLTATCEDASGGVWLYLANGELWRYWRSRFSRFKDFVQDPYVPGVCRALVPDSSGAVWVSTDRRLYLARAITNGTTTELALGNAVVAGKLNFALTSRDGGYWRLADGRVEKWRGKERERDLGVYPWTNAWVAAACEDREGNLVVGTLGAGVFWFDAKGKSTCLSADTGLSHNYILSLLVDREGTLWVGTDGGGLDRVKRQVFEVLEPTRGWVTQSVCEDEEGGLWAGASGGEVGYLQGESWRPFRAIRDGASPGIQPPAIRAVFADRGRQVWLGTVNEGLFQLQEDRFVSVPGWPTIQGVVQAIHQDRRGRLWLGTRQGLVGRNEQGWKLFFTTKNGLLSDDVRALADDSEGNLWIGTGGGGLNRLNDTGLTSVSQAEAGPSKNISCLYVDAERVLWIGTDGSGLARLQGGKWTRYTTREGLISNSLGYLIEDGQGYFWIGSNRGLMRIEKVALNDYARGTAAFVPCRAFGKPDGLPTRECTLGSQPAACRTRDGKLWFPTIRGLASIDPAKLHRNTNPPPVMIESILIEGAEQNTNRLRTTWPEAVQIRPGQERLEIRYTSLNLGSPERGRFRYRLENHETAWTEAANERVAHYTKLPPGRYRFQVTACNEDEVWNENPSTLALVVEPPFWQTWWFLSVAVAGLLGGVVGVVYYVSTQRLHRQLERLRQQEALEKERARIARDIHDQLGASLTQVSLLGEFVESDKDSPADVQAHARQICQTARDTTRVLDEIVWTVNPSNDTLDGLVTYVCKYAQDYLSVAELRYRLDVPPELPGAALPPEVRHNVFLVSKEAITNVVRHAQAKAVWVRLRLEPASFILEIQDDGRGLDDAAEKKLQTRNGLRNMRKRMEDIGGSFSIGPAPACGTLVRLTAPLGKTETLGN